MRIAIVLALVLCAIGVANAADEKAKEQPSGTLSLSATQISAGVGWSWGGGKLVFKGKSHPVTVDGLTVGSAGASSIAATGNVFHLTKLEDFEGIYTAVVGGATIGGGSGGLVMRNQNGVEVILHATTRGVSLTAGVSGVKLSLEK